MKEELEILKGLDDLAHTRRVVLKKGKTVRVKHYGKRDMRFTCYCKLLKKLEPKK